MSTKLVGAKVYFTKEDFGKMLKLKDEGNLLIESVEYDNFLVDDSVVVKIVTTEDNISSNNRFVNIGRDSLRREKVEIK